MDIKQLGDINKQFAEDSQKFNNDFIKLFRKHFKKSQKMAIYNMIHLPMNGIMNIIGQDNKNLMRQIFPKFPDMFIRFMIPFINLKELWGVVPSDEWVKEYYRLYEAQFNERFPNEEEKRKFTECLESCNKK